MTIIYSVFYVPQEESFFSYGAKLREKYQGDYLAVIFENETTAKDFTRTVNSHLTEGLKADMKAVQIFKKVENDVDVPVISFNEYMDKWLGILPQWKRVKKFFFSEMENYIDSHPELREKISSRLKYRNERFK